MIKRLFRIDVSKSKYENKNDLIKIKFKNSDISQVNFPKFFIQSEYIRDKYTYSEALNSIQDEIDEIKNKMSISDESIKHFIELVDDDIIDISIEHYKDIYTLSEYFCIPKFTIELDKISQELLFNDLNFTIQILIDSETSNSGFETKMTSKIENFLREKINECIKSAKFGELSVQTICRILNQSKEKVDHNSLVDFIFGSLKTRFLLLKFVELQKLRNDKVDEMIQLIEKQEESSKQMYLECMPFNILFIKDLKNKYNQLFNELNQTKQELNQSKQEQNQAKQELNQSKIEQEQTKEELIECKRELEQVKDELNQSKNEGKKHFEQSICVCGCGLSKLSFDPSSYLSCSAYGSHIVLVTNDGSLKGAGFNNDGRISATLQKTVIDDFTNFCIKDGSGSQLAAVSAVCYDYGTLYMFSKSSSNERQLVLCDKEINRGDPVFLDIGNHHPVSLFGGCYHSAAIGSEGEVIFINRNSVINSPNLPIPAVTLPNGEKASSIACCDDSIIVLSSNGRVFASPVYSKGVLNFSIVSELSNQVIVCVSGTHKHCLAVSEDGSVFVRGSNDHGRLGLGKTTKSSTTFTSIVSLRGYKVMAAYAGSGHSLFKTHEGKILSCGSNFNGELLLSSGPSGSVYSITETEIINDDVFCIAEKNATTIFIGRSPPSNTPNMPIQKH